MLVFGGVIFSKWIFHGLKPPPTSGMFKNIRTGGAGFNLSSINWLDVYFEDTQVMENSSPLIILNHPVSYDLCLLNNKCM